MKNGKNKKKLIGLIVLCCVVVIAVAGVVIWKFAAPKANQEPANAYRALYASEVSTLNYLLATTQWDQTVGANIVDTLVEYDNTGKLIPGLAESWETSEDGLTWTFHLRQGQKWYDHTGKEVADVTANDFVSALKYVLTAEYNSGVAKNVWGARIVNAEAYFNGEITDFAEVGVKALDDYTLAYILEAPLPYFPSTLTYVCFLPAYGPQLEELGADFGTSNDKIYYCGSYILREFEPQVRHYYVKNEGNWDAENIHIDAIERIYNAESSTLSPTMALRGEVDSADLDNNIIDDWKQNHGDIVTRGRAVPDYSYFYCFDFNPQYEAEYEPENWLIAVNNSNFRHSIMSAFDRLFAMTALDPESPETVLQDTITPAGFASVDGVDFTTLSAFDATKSNFFDASTALAYKEKAVAELTEAGVTFPIKVVMTYRPDDSDWENEYWLVKQKLEELLGTDYIECILYPGPTQDFLAQTRRVGKYSFMRCNWGADYADPETWTDPFYINKDSETGAIIGNSYNKMDLMLTDDYAQFTETREILNAYYEAVDKARAEVIDMQVRYDLFAEAEAMLIDNALVIPYNISPAGYQVTKLNIFEGEYAPFGISSLRFKYQHLSDQFITTEEYEAAFADWQAAMGN